MKTPHFYDRHWKVLAPEVLLALIQAVLPTVTAPLTPWQTELVVPLPSRVDDVFVATLHAQIIVIHFEYQSTLDLTMSQRIWEYDTDLERLVRQPFHQPLPVLSLMVWTCPGQTPLPSYHQEVEGIVLAHKEYLELHLTELDWHRPVNPLLLVLAPYFRSVTRPDLVGIGVELFHGAPAPLRDELLAAFLALSQRKFGAITEIIDAILAKVGKTMDEILQAIEQSDIGVALLEKGVAKGEAVGLAKGEAEMRRHVLRRRWQKRFGQEADAALLEQIGTISQDRYDQLDDALVEGRLTAEQIRALLDAWLYGRILYRLWWSISRLAGNT